METSELYAFFIGSLLTVLSCALIFKPRNLEAFLKLEAREETLFVSAFVNIFFGLLIVFTHNVWVWDWPVLVTLFGWMAVIKGLVRFFMPEEAEKLIKRIKKGNTAGFFLLLALVMGLALIFSGMMSVTS